MAVIAAVDFGQGISDAWSSVASFVPSLALFAVILGVGYFVAKALGALTDKSLERVGFDRAVERGGIRKLLSKSRYDASDVMAKVVFYAVMLFVLRLAFSAFGNDNAVSTLLDSVIAYLPKVFAAGLIVVVAAAIGAVVREIVDTAIGSRSYGSTLATAAGAVFVAIGVFAALDQLDVASTITNAIFYAVLAATVGVVIVAVGGSGIRPMQKYWEQSLTKVAEESESIRNERIDIRGRMAARAEQREQQLREASSGDQTLDVREQPVAATSSWDDEDAWPEDEPGTNGGRRPQGF